MDRTNRFADEYDVKFEEKKEKSKMPLRFMNRAIRRVKWSFPEMKRTEERTGL